MSEDNKLRLKQLGWGDLKEKQVRRLDSTAALRARRIEHELRVTVDWLQKLADRYVERGYDATPITNGIHRIRKALQ